MKLDHWKSNKHSYEFLDLIEIAMIFNEYQISNKKGVWSLQTKTDIGRRSERKLRRAKKNEIDWDPSFDYLFSFYFPFSFLYFRHIRSFDFYFVQTMDPNTYTWIENRWNTTCVYLWLFNNNVLNQYSILGAIVRGVRSQFSDLFRCAIDSGTKKL